jgi:hypothetical protein
MLDQWSKQTPNGRTVTYTCEWNSGTGGLCKVKIDGKDVGETLSCKGKLSREEVEAHFSKFVVKY